MWETVERLWLDEAALRVARGGELLSLGRWDRRFGAWNADGAPVRLGEAVLGPDGVWLVPKGRSDDAPALLAAYFSLIPTPIRRLAAPFGKRQWAMLELLWARPRAAFAVDALLAAHSIKEAAEDFGVKGT